MSKFNYTFKIDLNNGNGLQALSINPYKGFSTYHKLGEELDSGFLTLILKNKERIPMFSYLEFEISDGESTTTRKFYVGRDEVDNTSKKQRYYKHSIELIELTKKMEKVIGETIAFTQPLDVDKVNYTLLDCIERIIRIFPLGIDNGVKTTVTKYSDYTLPEGRKFKYIDENLKAYLDTIVAPEFVFNNLTFREITSGILKYVNATAKLEDRDKIGAEFYGQLQSLLKGDIRDSFYYSTEQNVEEATSTMESFGQNVVQEKREENATVVYPSKNSWDFFKTTFDDYVVNDSNFGILLNNKAKVVNDIVINDVHILVYTDSLGLPGDLLSDEYVDLSLRDRIVEREIYDSLPYEEQKKYIYYTKNSNFINLSNYFKRFVIFSVPNFLYTILYGVCDYFLRNSKELMEKYGLENGDFIHIGVYFNPNASSNVLGNFTGYIYESGFVLDKIEFGKFYGGNFDSTREEWKNTKYRVEYTPIYNSRLLSQKNNINDINVDTQSFIQQQEHIVSFKNYSNTIFSNVQRAGTQQLEATFKHFSLNDLIKIGDYTNDGYVCINAEYIYYNDLIVGKYLFSKDYNRISSFIGINSEIRQFEIPSGNQTYERQCKWEDFLEVGYSYKLDFNQDFIGKYRSFRQYITNTLGQEIGNVDFISSCLIYYNESFSENQKLIESLKLISTLSGYEYEKPAILLECVTKGAGNILSFDFGFNDNIKAGSFKYYAPQESEFIVLAEKILMQPVPYCQNEGDKIGFLRNISYSLSSDLTTESTTLPLLDRAEGLISFSEKIKNQDILILKDPAEILRFTHIISCLSIEDDIVLGRAFTEKNASITNVKEKIYVYISPNKYSKFDIIKMKDKDECYNLGLSKEVGDFNLTQEDSELPANLCTYKFKDTISFDGKGLEPKTIILANESDEILMTIKYDPGKIYNTIYFNFRHTRSNIVYDY